MIKLSFALALTAAFPVWSFLAQPQARRSSRLMAAADTKKKLLDMNLDELVANAITEAENRSEGDALSQQAAVYWDIVEELEAADSHARANKAPPNKVVVEKKKLVAPAAPTCTKDSSEVIQLALAASEMYGKTSVEARMAWELVEEIDAANSHHRPEDVHVQKQQVVVEKKESTTKPKNNIKPLPRTVEDAIEAASLASKIYGKRSLEARMAWELVEEIDAARSHLKDGSKEQKAVTTLQEKPKYIAMGNIQDATQAIKVAMEASKTHGKTSVEARMAWEAVEEIDAANAHHKTVGTG